jgi:hypothetical protein
MNTRTEGVGFDTRAVMTEGVGFEPEVTEDGAEGAAAGAPTTALRPAGGRG